MPHITSDELITSYAIFGVTHVTLWVGKNMLKQLRQGISVEHRAIIAHHVGNKHLSRFDRCTEDLCISLRKAGKERPVPVQLPQMEPRQP